MPDGVAPCMQALARDGGVSRSYFPCEDQMKEWALFDVTL